MRRLAQAAVVVATVYGVATFVAILIIGTWSIWHTQTTYYDEGSIEKRLIDTVMLVGVVPTFAFVILAVIASHVAREVEAKARRR